MTNEREALADPKIYATVNYPHPREEGKRVAGFVIDEDAFKYLHGPIDWLNDLRQAARMLRQTTMAGKQERRQGHSALRVRDGEIERFDPHPAGSAPESPAGVADMERLYGVYVPDYRTSDSSAAPELSAEQERRQGHSALRVRDGQIERFDPHPSAAPEGGLSVEQIEVMCAMLTKQGYAGAKLRDMALRSLERPAGRVVPDGQLRRAVSFLWSYAGENAAEAHELSNKIEAMLAASPPAATEGWVRGPREPEWLTQLIAGLPESCHGTIRGYIDSLHEQIRGKR